MQAAAAEALDLDEEWYRSLNAVYREREVKGFELLDRLQRQQAQSGLFVWGRLPEGAGDCSSFRTSCSTVAAFYHPGGASVRRVTIYPHQPLLAGRSARTGQTAHSGENKCSAWVGL